MNLIRIKILVCLLFSGLLACNSKEKSSPQDTSNAENKDTSVSAQDSDIRKWEEHSVKRLDEEGFLPQFAETGDAIVYTSKTMDGLWIYNLKQKSSRQLCDKSGAGYNPVLKNGTVIYQVKDKRKYLEKLDIEKGVMEKIESASAITPMSYAKNLLLQENPESIAVSLSDDLNEIVIQKDGKQKSIAPQGKKNYLNVSLSPDQNLILYDCPGYGGYVVDLEGAIHAELGNINTPVWIDDQLIVFAKSKGDGHQVFESDIFVHHLPSGKETNLTEDVDDLLENPRINSQKNTIIAHTPEGIIYLIQSSS